MLTHFLDSPSTELHEVSPYSLFVQIWDSKGAFGYIYKLGKVGLHLINISKSAFKAV